MKKDFKPLLNYGPHNLQQLDFKRICVDDRPNNFRREHLYMNLTKLVIDPLQKLDIDATVWINGSYLTEKECPDDIDLVVEISSSSLSNKQSEELILIISDIQNRKSTYHLDLYLFDKDTCDRSDYWDDWFSHDRGNNPKGYVILNIGGAI